MKTKDELPEYESDLFDAEGPNYTEAWDIMREKMETPLSFEVFVYGWEQSNFDDPQDYARSLPRKKK